MITGGMPIEELVFLRFTGHFEHDEKYTYAFCEEVPVTAWGHNEEEAQVSIDKALEAYVGRLGQRGELDAAIKRYNISVHRIRLGAPAPFGWYHSASFRGRPTFDRIVPSHGPLSTRK